jgi:hypothetical protein
MPTQAIPSNPNAELSRYKIFVDYPYSNKVDPALAILEDGSIYSLGIKVNKTMSLGPDAQVWLYEHH